MKIKYLTIMLTVLLIISPIGMTNTHGLVDDINTSWAYDGNGQLVYRVNDVAYGSNNYWNMSTYDEFDGERSIGAIRIDDLMMIGVGHLEDLSDHINDQTDLWLKTSSTTEEWNHQYDWNVSIGNYPVWGGPAFFMPITTISQSYLADNSNMTDWNNIVDRWNAETGWTAGITGEEFILTGPADPTKNVTAFTAKWNINNGIMQYYKAEGTADGETYLLELTFMYLKDESQWDMTWGIAPGIMWAYDVVSNASGEIPFGDGSGEYDENSNLNNLSDGLLVFMLHEISDFDDHMNWNGSVMTSEWQTSFHFEFNNIGMGGDGPRVWYPIMPLGNSAFYGNITDEFEASGATVTNDGSTYEVHYDDDYSFENATWDMTTGLMQSMYLEMELYEDHGVWIRMDFVYAFNAGVDEPTFARNHFDQRYVINNAQNGSLDFIDFGDMRYYDEYGNEYTRNFQIHDGDIFSVYAGWETYWDDEYSQERDEFRWHAKTSSGYWMDAHTEFLPPGLDTGNDGPPVFYLIIPIGTSTLTGEAWFNELDSVYSALGYTTINTATEFGFSALLDGQYDLTIKWDKADGILSYYKVELDSDIGEPIIWEMTRGVSMIDMSNFDWGVDVGTTMDFVMESVSEPIPFGGEETPDTYLDVNDTITITFTGLSDFEEDGPMMYVDMEANGVIEENVSMGMQEPGFEFTRFEDDDGGGPAMLYWAIPIGTAAFWDWLVDIYTESGYTATLTTDSLTLDVVADDFEISVTWSRDTGLMESYDYSGPSFEDDGTTISFSIVRISESVVVPTTTGDNGTSSEDTVGLDLPVSETSLWAVPFMGIVTLVIRRRRIK